MNKISDLFKAFADETRVRILHLLAQDEQCVCELQATLQLPQPTISRHLAYLRRMGLVVERKEGKWVIYALAPARDTLHQSLSARLFPRGRGVEERQGAAGSSRRAVVDRRTQI